MKVYKIFYYLTAFALGGSFVFLTLNYYNQAIIQLLLGVLSLLVGLLFKKFIK